jgi:hypothetical protein
VKPGDLAKFMKRHLNAAVLHPAQEDIYVLVLDVRKGELPGLPGVDLTLVDYLLNSRVYTCDSDLLEVIDETG